MKTKANQKTGTSVKTKSLIGSVFMFLFILSFAYIYWFADALLQFQEKQSLFLFTSGYLKEFIVKPGGLLEYGGKFLTQFYFYPFTGAVILSAIIALSSVLCFQISKKITDSPFVPFLFIPAVLLLLMQSHYYHLMEFNLGFLLVLLLFNFTISPYQKTSKYLVLLSVPVFYYVAGAYLFLFLGMYCIYNFVFERGRFRFTFPVSAVVLSLLTFLIFDKFLFLQPIGVYFTYPLPLIDAKNHKILLVLLVMFLILLPLILTINTNIKSRKNSIRVSYLSIGFILATTIFFLTQFYNPQTYRVMQIEHLVAEKKYEKAIHFHEKYPSKNLIGQYLYNIALSETNQLCEHLFYGEQDFKVNALILPWSNEHLPWGADFYYTVGLINEAHRWAYEEMVVYGKRPQNIELLLKTNIINGNYERAKKYNAILKATLNYKYIANQYERVLEDTTLVLQQPEWISKRMMFPKKEFFVQVNNPQENIPLLLESNPQNKKAFEYEMAWLLFSKDVETIANQLKHLKNLGYSQIPRHLEEAALIYYNSTKKMPDLGGLIIRQETLNNFQKYVSAFKNARINTVQMKENLHKNFGNTFMYYFHFK